MSELRLSPTAMAAGGAALARHEDGRVVFVDGAVPGDVVTARVTEDKRDYVRAATVEVLEPSPHRVAPPCPALARGCGGCTWQHIAPEAQDRFKAEIVVDALRRIAKVAEPPGPSIWPLGAPALRTTARLAVSPGGRAGHRRLGGHEGAVETDSCMVAHRLLEELIVEGRYPGGAEVLLRVGVGSGERLVRAANPHAVSVPSDVTVVGPGEAAAVHERIGGHLFRISADSFFQPGPVVAAALASAVLDAAGDALGPGGHAIDAYAGVGLFGAILARERDVRVTAVENHRPAVADARANFAGLAARVKASDVAHWRANPRDRVDVVVADPSRTGLGKPGVAALTAARAPRLVLVSCDPASLARDTRLLAAEGYRLRDVRMIDAFPNTFHTETVSRFDR